jgi:hypothetical protein
MPVWAHEGEACYGGAYHSLRSVRLIGVLDLLWPEEKSLMHVAVLKHVVTRPAI